jgi:predicted Zn-dependent peptidase
MQLKLEDSESYAHFLARQSLILNEVQTPDQIKKEIDKVSLNQVNKLAKEIIDLEQLYVSVIGPYTQSELKI